MSCPFAQDTILGADPHAVFAVDHHAAYTFRRLRCRTITAEHNRLESLARGVKTDQPVIRRDKDRAATINSDGVDVARTNPDFRLRVMPIVGESLGCGIEHGHAIDLVTDPDLAGPIHCERKDEITGE